MFGIRISGVPQKIVKRFKPMMLQEIKKVISTSELIIGEEDVITSCIPHGDIHLEFLGLESHLEEIGKRLNRVVLATAAKDVLVKLYPKMETFVYSFNENTLFSHSI